MEARRQEEAAKQLRRELYECAIALPRHSLALDVRIHCGPTLRVRSLDVARGTAVSTAVRASQQRPAAQRSAGRAAMSARCMRLPRPPLCEVPSHKCHSEHHIGSAPSVVPLLVGIALF